MKVIKVKGGIAVFLSERSGNGDIFELVGEEVPFVVKSNHDFNTFFTLRFERYGEGDLGG